MRVIRECFQLTGFTGVLNESVKRLSSSKGGSGPQLRAADGGMPSGRWRGRGLKLAKYCAVVLTSKTVDKVV